MFDSALFGDAFFVKPKKGVSPIWKHFKQHNVLTKYAKCKHCPNQASFVLSYCGAVRNLERHLKNHHRAASQEYLQNKNDVPLESVANHFRPQTLTSERLKSLDRAVAKVIAQELLPYSIVRSDGFVNLITTLEPSYPLPDVQKVKDVLVPLLVSEERKTLKELFSRRYFMNLTTDEFSSTNALCAYITVTTHFITEDWILKSRVLCTDTLPEAKKCGIDLARALTKACDEWDLKDQVFKVTTDNLKSQVNAITMAGFEGIRCICHVIQLGIKKSLKHSPIVFNLMIKLNKVITHFHKSPGQTYELHTAQGRRGLPIHNMITYCVTRWSGAYTAMQRMVEQITVVQDVLKNDTVLEHVWSAYELEQAKTILVILAPLANVTSIMQYETLPTYSMLAFYIHYIRTKALNPDLNDPAWVKDFKFLALTKFNEYFKDLKDESEILTAAFLDCRFKKKPFILANLPVIRAHIAPMLAILQDLQESEEVVANGVILNMNPRDQALFDMMNGVPDGEEGDEFASYAREPSAGSNPLDWWKINEKRFPTIAILARKYLSVQASNAAAERVFSTCGNVLNKKRSRLGPEYVNDLVFLNNAYKRQKKE